MRCDETTQPLADEAREDVLDRSCSSLEVGSPAAKERSRGLAWFREDRLLQLELQRK